MRLTSAFWAMMMKFLKRTALLVLVSGMLVPGLVVADEPILDSIEVSSNDTSVKIGLDAQFRFGISDLDSSEPTSEFRLRRFRPLFDFKAYEVFKVKFVPEFAGGVELKDAVLIWEPNDWISIEGGQFAPPFNWERDGSSDYHQFTERSVANNEFQIADGRDIGLQFDFEWDKWLDVEAGIFNGAGSNTRVAPGAGHVIAGRVAYAPFSHYHEVEVVPIVIDRLMMMVAVGGFYAFDNAWQDWAPSDSMATEEAAADVLALTSDLHVWAWRFGLHAQGYYRQVSACCEPTFEDYSGYGATTQLSFLVIPERLLLALRHSRAVPDSRFDGVDEFAASVQVFHIGNQSKFTLDGGIIEDSTAADDDRNYIRLQYQLLL